MISCSDLLSSMSKMSDLDLRNKKVFIRADFNVAHDDFHKIVDDTRIRAEIPTLKMALDAGAAVMVASHLGRPREGVLRASDSLISVSRLLGNLLDREVRLVRDWVDGVDVAPGELVVLENCRVNVGEAANDLVLAEKMSKLFDVYVNDAFSVSHRLEATVSALPLCASVACAGPLMVQELSAFSRLLTAPEHPLVAVVGGSKLSTKLKVIQALSEWVDVLVLGGGIANTFLLASDLPVGSSLVSPDFMFSARQIIDRMAQRGAALPLPVDVVVTDHLSDDSRGLVKDVKDVCYGEIIVDIGPKTVESFKKYIDSAKVIIWNGPLGVFEYDAFSFGTCSVAREIAASKACSIVGGGDTHAAIAKAGVVDGIDYVSMGGGAFLTLLAHEPLPGLSALMMSSGHSQKL